ncbi:hypothetical protein Fmac_030596 [Flemingia macrophylla]|uniref:Uncharacterized protein n=1 Tax=Flemingia macrophylla TaxID=520843 RepID=A0ABD1KZN4_9FABA
MLKELSRRRAYVLQSEAKLESSMQKEANLKSEIDVDSGGKLEMSSLYSHLRDNPRKQF